MEQRLTRTTGPQRESPVVAQITIHRKERPAITGRQTKYDFFHRLPVGGMATVITTSMTDQEHLRTLRSLRSITTYHRRALGRRFRTAFSPNRIKVEGWRK